MDSRLRRPLHNRHSGTRAGIQGWEFRIEPHVFSAQYGLSSVVMQRSPFAGKTVAWNDMWEGMGYWAVKPPSMTSSLPVIKEDSSEARKRAP